MLQLKRLYQVHSSIDYEGWWVSIGFTLMVSTVAGTQPVPLITHLCVYIPLRQDAIFTCVTKGIGTENSSLLRPLIGSNCRSGTREIGA